MNRIFVLARKELRSAYNSPTAYAVTLFFLLFVSIWLFYVQRFLAMDSATLRPYFALFPVAFILVVPALTMRSWAEERKMGTAEILLTMPFSEWELVLGKFFASWTVLAVAIALTVFVPLTVAPLGDFDAGAIMGEYLGALLMGAAAVALGQFASSLSKNQVSAFLAGVVVLLVATLANLVASTLELPLALADFINYFSLSFHFESFAKGVVDSRDAAYFLLVAFLFLFLNARVILFRKWS
ncbi:MAG: ABC transporter permease [Treponema sp. GWB1_62_6]|nr:MAG: ABC transporter permease [Treponema sp. GWA1_62_8]OHE62977.1 MAG: ABC transporter permease [Treponema sp. GWB1_62_6]OHE66349.1 MAG: ABC transporter permease [Treponema sp. GWC1_61_84]OHE69716.1 MAG: ABC transporter permease [Treponema sp. RIFOXYC1_FULL_61_9]HCM26793.1 ABC transporter permease [Treponema sp.]